MKLQFDMPTFLAICSMAICTIVIVWLWPKMKSRPRTKCFCPACREDLVSNGSCIEDGDLVYYQCTNCGNKSEWNFDIAPVALVVRSDNGYTDLKYTEVRA